MTETQRQKVTFAFFSSKQPDKRNIAGKIKVNLEHAIFSRELVKKKKCANKMPLSDE